MSLVNKTVCTSMPVDVPAVSSTSPSPSLPSSVACHVATIDNWDDGDAEACWDQALSQLQEKVKENLVVKEEATKATTNQSTSTTPAAKPTTVPVRPSRHHQRYTIRKNKAVTTQVAKMSALEEELQRKKQYVEKVHKVFGGCDEEKYDYPYENND